MARSMHGCAVALLAGVALVAGGCRLESTSRPGTRHTDAGPAAGAVDPSMPDLVETGASRWDETVSSAATGAGEAAIVADPTSIDLGPVPTNETHHATVTLVNTGDVPRTIRDCRSSCSCVAANCPRGTVLQPGESVDVDVRVNSGSRPKMIGKRLVFLIDDQPPLSVQVKCEAVSYVEAHPFALLRGTERVVLSSIDDEPFAVIGVQPEFVATYDDARGTRHELSLRWQGWKDPEHGRTIVFFTDHPKCPMLMVPVEGPVAE